jgi:hypothetical protein
MTIRNNTPQASLRRHFINRRCSVAQPTDIKATLIVSPVRAILYFATMCRPIRGLGRIGWFPFRRLRYATPTVNKVLSLQDKWEHKFRGHYCG